MNSVLFLLVTCSRESIRDEMFVNEVSPSLMDISKNKNFMVFDNGSTQQKTIDCITHNYNTVILCKNNVGYYSAIYWTLKNYKNIFLENEFKYLYIIESDCVHFSDANEKLKLAVDFLDYRLDVGSVRCQDYSVKNIERYTKGSIDKTKKTKVWQSQINHTTGERAVYKKTDSEFLYTCNLSTVLCGLTRIDAMNIVFDRLKHMTSFNESIFRNEYYKLYQNIALIEGGIYEPTDTSINFCGSYTPNNKLGYYSTRSDATIVDVYDEDIIERGSCGL